MLTPHNVLQGLAVLCFGLAMLPPMPRPVNLLAAGAFCWAVSGMVGA